MGIWIDMQRKNLTPGVCLVATIACSSGMTPSNAQPGVAGALVSAKGGTAASEAVAGGESATAGGRGGVAPTPGGAADFPNVTNARYVGQLTTTDGHQLRAQVLLRSGDLASISDCSALRTWDVRSVIDLRDLEHSGYVPDAACVGETARLYQADLPRLLPPSADAYHDTLVAAEPKLPAIFAHLGAADALPALVHCVIGRDRASLLAGLVLLAIGVPRGQVLDDMTTNQAAGIEIEAAWMDRVFARIDQAGGIEVYLDQQGVARSDIESLRDQALLP